MIELKKELMQICKCPEGDVLLTMMTDKLNMLMVIKIMGSHIIK